MEQRLVVVRPVDVHEPFADGRQAVQRGGRAVDELAVGAGAGEGAFQDELILFARLEAVLVQEGSQRGRSADFQTGEPGVFARNAPGQSSALRRPGEQLCHVEHRLHRAAILAAADERAVGAFAEDEVERADDDGLARAGLAGDDVAAGLEFQREVGHEGEILDAQRRQHLQKILTTDGRG